MLLLSSFLLVAFCYKGFFVIIKTTHPFLLNFFFSLLCLDLTNDLLVLSTVLLTVHFWFSGDFTHTLENIATFWWWGWCLIFKRKKKKALLLPPTPFPAGLGSVRCRCMALALYIVLLMKAGVSCQNLQWWETFVGTHTDYPLCQGIAATVLWKKCYPRGRRVLQP